MPHPSASLRTGDSTLRCGSLRQHDSSSQPSTPIRHFHDRLALLLDAGDVADGAAGGTGGEGGVGLEGEEALGFHLL